MRMLAHVKKDTIYVLNLLYLVLDMKFRTLIRNTQPKDITPPYLYIYPRKCRNLYYECGFDLWLYDQR